MTYRLGLALLLTISTARADVVTETMNYVLHRTGAHRLVTYGRGPALLIIPNSTPIAQFNAKLAQFPHVPAVFVQAKDEQAAIRSSLNPISIVPAESLSTLAGATDSIAATCVFCKDSTAVHYIDRRYFEPLTSPEQGQQQEISYPFSAALWEVFGRGPSLPHFTDERPYQHVYVDNHDQLMVAYLSREEFSPFLAEAQSFREKPVEAASRHPAGTALFATGAVLVLGAAWSLWRLKRKPAAKEVIA